MRFRESGKRPVPRQHPDCKCIRASSYSRNVLPREDMPVIVDILDHEMSEFDPGNGEPILMPTELIEIANYLESLQDPAPTSHLP